MSHAPPGRFPEATKMKKRLDEVAGRLERVDERDTVFARACLEEGSPEEKSCHEAHPDTRC